MLSCPCITTGVVPTGLDSRKALIHPRSNCGTPVSHIQSHNAPVFNVQYIRSAQSESTILSIPTTRIGHIIFERETSNNQRIKKDAFLQTPLLHGESKNHGEQTLRLGPREDPKRRTYGLIIISANINIKTTSIKQAARPVILLRYSSQSYSYSYSYSYYYYERRHLVSRPERAALYRRTHQTRERARESASAEAADACGGDLEVEVDGYSYGGVVWVWWGLRGGANADDDDERD